MVLIILADCPACGYVAHPGACEPDDYTLMCEALDRLDDQTFAIE